MSSEKTSGPAYYDLLRILKAAIDDGVWRDVGAEALRAIVGAHRDVESLHLFATIDEMRAAHDQVRVSDFPELPQFAIARGRRDERTLADPRLFLDDVLFIGGSRVPGEDVLLAVDFSPLRPGLRVLLLDWDAQDAERWAKVGTLRDVLARLRSLTDP